MRRRDKRKHHRIGAPCTPCLAVVIQHVGSGRARHKRLYPAAAPSAASSAGAEHRREMVSPLSKMRPSGVALWSRECSGKD